jgi:hypothetical protein
MSSKIRIDHNFRGLPTEPTQQNQMTFSPRRASASFIATCLTVIASACTFLPQPIHHVTATTPDFDPKISARIRLLSGNGTRTASFRPNSSCYRSAWTPDPDSVRTTDGFFSGWKYSSRSETIGMPPSPRPWMRVEGLQFKDAIREYVVVGGQPITVSTSAGSSAGSYSYTCSPPAITFAPVAGQDYDIFQDESGRQCWIAVRRIDANGLDEKTAVSRATKCTDSPSEGASKPSKNGP